MTGLNDIIDGKTMALVFNEQMERNFDDDRHWSDLAIFLESDQSDPMVAQNTRNLIIYIFGDKFGLSVPWFIEFTFTTRQTKNKPYAKEFETFTINPPKKPPHPSREKPLLGETQNGW